VRLSEVQQAYGAQVSVHWRAFPLIPDHRPGRRGTEHTRESRQRAGADEPRAQFVLPPPDIELPASSVPALTAAKAAERQGVEVFSAFHHAVFAAHFSDNLDISRADVLWRVAEASGLDMALFEQDCAGGEPYRAVLDDYAEAVAWFGVSALPTVVFDEKVSLVGAVPIERYRLLLDWLLAGEPGGLIPLDASGPTAAGAGQSTIGQADSA
jgi:predicted DsbA family dithiol-disulfide isomerase